MTTGTIKQTQAPLLVRTASATVSLSAGEEKAVTMTINEPSGYHVLMYGPVTTGGFVGYGVVSSPTRVWIKNPETWAVTNGTIMVQWLYEKD